MLTYTDQQRCEKKVRANRLPHGGLVQYFTTGAILLLLGNPRVRDMKMMDCRFSFFGA